MKKAHVKFLVAASVVIAVVGLVSGNAEFFKGALQSMKTAGVTCRTFVPPTQLAGGLAKTQLGYDSFIAANGVHPGFKDKSIVKGKEAISAWRFGACGAGTKVTHIKFKLKGGDINLGSIEVYKDATNVTRMLKDESKAKLQKAKDSFTGTVKEEVVEVEFMTPIEITDGNQFSLVVDTTAYKATSTVTANVQEIKFVDMVGETSKLSPATNEVTLKASK